MSGPTEDPRKAVGSNALFGSGVRSDPDRILELYPDGCPKCGSPALEALTWKSRGSDEVTVGCWACGWIIEPKAHPIPINEPESNPRESEEYQRFVDSMAEHCRCADHRRPCDGVLAGGPCDEIVEDVMDIYEDDLAATIQDAEEYYDRGTGLPGSGCCS